MENVVYCAQSDRCMLIDFGLSFFTRDLHAGRKRAGERGSKQTIVRRHFDIGRGQESKRFVARNPLVATFDFTRHSSAVGWLAEGKTPTSSARPSASDPRCVVLVEDLVSANRLNSGCVTVGSACYIAPEVVAGAITSPKQLFAADIYSLGVVLYCMVCARMPPLAEKATALLMSAAETAHRRGTLDSLFHDRHFLAAYAAALDMRSLARGIRDRETRRAVRLAAAMMNPDPSERPTIAEVLTNPWLKESDGNNA
jgi:serine/threonine protein kinase